MTALQHLDNADSLSHQAQGSAAALSLMGRGAQEQPIRSTDPGEAQRVPQDLPEEGQRHARSDDNPRGSSVVEGGEPDVDGGSPQQKRCRCDGSEGLPGPPGGPELSGGAKPLGEGPQARGAAGLLQDAGESAQVPLAGEGHGGDCASGAGGMHDGRAAMSNGAQVGETLAENGTNATVSRSSAC